MTTPSNSLSLNKIFDPAPKIKIFVFLPNSFKNLTSSSKFSALK